MAFTVEDGSIVAGANSYATLVAARALALDRGLTLPTDDTECEQDLVKAADYLDGLYGQRLQGRTVSADQTMAFPRYSLYINGFLFDYDSIPSQVIEAQMYAAVAITGGLDVSPSGSSASIKREKVGPLEVEYQTSGGAGGATLVPRVTAVERLMQGLLGGGGSYMLERA